MRVFLLVLSWAVSPGTAAAGRNLARIDCGRVPRGKEAKFTSYIAGGSNVLITEYPHAVSLQYREKGNKGAHICGGSSVISKCLGRANVQKV